jgi:type II secretory pathway pseudopilin PulG
MTRNPSRGFTLVEALVALGIVAGVLVLVGLLGRDVFSMRSGFTAALSTQSDARRILRPFADELRAAAYAETGAYPIAESSTSSIAFYSDVDRDGAVERVRYSVEGGALLKAVSEPGGNPITYGAAATSTLVRGVLASSTYFAYYAEGYDGTASSSPLAFPVSPSEVRGARVWLEVDEDTARAPGAAVLSTAATVRNQRSLGGDGEQ